MRRRITRIVQWVGTRLRWLGEDLERWFCKKRVKERSDPPGRRIIPQ